MPESLRLRAACWMLVPVLSLLSAGSALAQPTVEVDEPVVALSTPGPMEARAMEPDRVESSIASLSEASVRRVLVPESGVATPGLVDLLTGWSQAWSEQRVEDYLGYYSESFEPSGPLDRASWEQQRRERVGAPQFVEVVLAVLDTDTETPGRASVRFLQRYRSDRFRDVVTKTLELVTEGDDWKILREVVEEQP